MKKLLDTNDNLRRLFGKRKPPNYPNIESEGGSLLTKGRNNEKLIWEENPNQAS
ncbi:MAG TPA: hypothetical protein VJ044_15910 [Candidatus Hodarchaeales archaeon]|nr:hypothetical protein [Candidatus Hodarchaeales archaeon]